MRGRLCGTPQTSDTECLGENKMDYRFTYLQHYIAAVLQNETT